MRKRTRVAVFPLASKKFHDSIRKDYFVGNTATLWENQASEQKSNIGLRKAGCCQWTRRKTNISLLMEAAADEAGSLRCMGSISFRYFTGGI